MDILKNGEGKELFETVECYLYDIPLLSLKKISDNLSLGDYYENLTQNEVFELTSFLDYKIDGVSLLCKMHNL